jgi:hypothetical protein
MVIRHRTPARRASTIQRTRLEWSWPFLVKAAAEPPCLCSKITNRLFDIARIVDEEAIAYNHKSDGMYPR